MPIFKKIIRHCFLLSLLMCKVLFLSAQTLAPAPRECQVKAVFLYNFTHFVEWPASSFSTDQAPLVIGILGENPFGSYLQETVSGEKVNGHPLVVQYYKKLEEVQACQILFISMSETNKLEQILAGLKGRNLLTVSDAASFLQEGGMIRFFIKSNKIQLQINLEATKTANLVISSKLLRLAEIFVPIINN